MVPSILNRNVNTRAREKKAAQRLEQRLRAPHPQYSLVVFPPASLTNFNYMTQRLPLAIAQQTTHKQYCLVGGNLYHDFQKAKAMKAIV